VLLAEDEERLSFRRIAEKLSSERHMDVGTVYALLLAGIVRGRFDRSGISDVRSWNFDDGRLPVTRALLWAFGAYFELVRIPVGDSASVSARSCVKAGEQPSPALWTKIAQSVEATNGADLIDPQLRLALESMTVSARGYAKAATAARGKLPMPKCWIATSDPPVRPPHRPGSDSRLLAVEIMNEIHARGGVLGTAVIRAAIRQKSPATTLNLRSLRRWVADFKRERSGQNPT
jgi:hypothetical protein